MSMKFLTDQEIDKVERAVIHNKGLMESRLIGELYQMLRREVPDCLDGRGKEIEALDMALEIFYK